MRDALLNLIINAARSGQASGQIRIGAQLVREALCIEVDDRGRGIAMADLSRVFTPFFSTKPDGHGLWLAIARRIVESHHGRVRVENRAGGLGVFIPSDTALADAESLFVDAALKDSGYNRTQAARSLGIGERTLRRKLNDT